MSSRTAADKFDALTGSIPSVYEPGNNPVIKTLLEALASGDNGVAQAIIDSGEQVFVKTASGNYLDVLGSNIGISRLFTLGINDTDFRELIIAMSFVPKQTQEILFKLLKLWYTESSVVANVSSTQAEPFSLSDGDTLIVEVDGKTTTTIVFSDSAFEDISLATAEEVSSAINKESARLGVYARSVTSLSTRDKYVKVYTNNNGPNGSVKILGGTAQPKLKFPILRNTTHDTTTTWTITLDTGDIAKLTYTGAGIDPTLTNVYKGDIVTITDTEPIPNPPTILPQNEGSFVVTEVGTNYIKYKNISAVAQGAFTLASTSGIFFHFPKKHTIDDYARPATIFETVANELVVIIPSTAAVVSRTLIGASHLHANHADQLAYIGAKIGPEFRQEEIVVGLEAVYLNNDLGGAAGSFVAGDSIILSSGGTADVVAALSNNVDNTILLVDNTAGLFTAGASVTDNPPTGKTRTFDQKIDPTAATATIKSVMDPGARLGWISTSSFQEGQGIAGETRMYITSPSATYSIGETVSNGVASGEVTRVDLYSSSFTRIAVKNVTGGIFSSGDTITGATSGASGTLSLVDAPYAILLAELTDDIPSSPYLFDESFPFSISKLTGTINQNIDAGSSLRYIDLSTIDEDMPSSGYIVFEYGLDGQEGPIPFISRTDDTIHIDPAYVFQVDHAISDSFYYINELLPVTPKEDGTDYGAYVTGTKEARDLLKELVRQVTAAGVKLRFIIEFPELPFEYREPGA